MMTQYELKSLLRYDPDTGIFTWLRRPNDGTKSTKAFNTRFGGKQAGCFDKSTGYRVVRVKDVLYYEHRLAHFYMTGQWPEQIDHRDFDRVDNRWSEIRHASMAQNQHNVRRQKNNTSGRKGVHWDKQTEQWRARIDFNGKVYNLGRFDSFELAVAVREKAEYVLHGEYARAE
jgi:hypothetical protein